ncbi:uncharacterized protein [Palaemon carinicauda]|uniref:uncharacterized protein n=1 Tax=Palaemon carinicauda TaxID=392227 RepID=UPI0035B679B1
MSPLTKGVIVIWSALWMAAWSPCARAYFHAPSYDARDRNAFQTEAVSETRCCERDRNMKIIGTSDTTGERISIDVGHCRRRCAAKGQRRRDFERLRQDNPGVDLIELYKLYSERSPSCPLEGESCLPSSSRIEQVTTTAGVVSVTVTEECQCQSHPRNCRRQPRDVTLHKDTPLQTTIDVGDCQGHCSHDLGCRATKTRSVSIEGPNGAECLSVIEECGCEASCYRTSHFEHVYNYTDQDDPTVEVIDVGTCTGECDTATSEVCVYSEPDGACAMSLRKSSSRCAPVGLQQMNITQRDSSIRTLNIVTSCGCV